MRGGRARRAMAARACRCASRVASARGPSPPFACWAMRRCAPSLDVPMRVPDGSPICSSLPQYRARERCLRVHLSLALSDGSRISSQVQGGANRLLVSASRRKAPSIPSRKVPHHGRHRSRFHPAACHRRCRGARMHLRRAHRARRASQHARPRWHPRLRRPRGRFRAAHPLRRARPRHRARPSHAARRVPRAHGHRPAHRGGAARASRPGGRHGGRAFRERPGARHGCARRHARRRPLGRAQGPARAQEESGWRYGGRVRAFDPRREEPARLRPLFRRRAGRRRG